VSLISCFSLFYETVIRGAGMILKVVRLGKWRGVGFGEGRMSPSPAWGLGLCPRIFFLEFFACR
jgi:hypothetical protein